MLAEESTVVTYDQRGLSRSPLDGPPGPVTVRTFADDALALLDAGPAYVVGSSGGALIGLALLARHPDRVRALLAHEPPEAMASMMANLEFFPGSVMPPMREHRVDVDALRTPPFVIGVGEESEGRSAHRTSVAVAERLDVKPVPFPGDHGGFGSHPVEFTWRLREAFAAVER